ncbi:MAG: hypothetical protein N4A62_00530 [Marinisporobacter sp.]|jgi:hypothetical protein|nr:hypothetical protein [Marinisporobacter sp.]
MKKIIIGLLSLLIVMIVLFHLFTFNHVWQDSDLRDTIVESVQTSSAIDFSKITDFEWDRMYILHPYTPVDMVFEEEGIKIPNNNFNVEYFESINMLAFIKEDRLVTFVEIPRDICRAKFDKNVIRFNKGEAKFDILKEEKMIVFK